MTLQEKLDAFKVEFKKQAPTAAIEAFERSTQELIESGQSDRALKAGHKFPEFTLEDSNGVPVSSKELLAKGPLVVTFYRGVWCPYCNIELKALEAELDEINARGGQLVAISLQGAENSRKSQRDNDLSFPILTDAGGVLSEKVGIRWTLQDYLIEVKKMFGVHLPAIHGDGKWTLPMPARYVIAQDGTVAYAEVNPDYTRRPEPTDLIPVLDSLAAAAAA